ncbi:hypothetical protein [Halovivax sp.]|uniref:hypothetical protein n=1 Tax=Halovivax sp. TaxID=1935978 RepID=UPI0025C72F33|nr:hypothetical protein [Halovivax sp.]
MTTGSGAGERDEPVEPMESFGANIGERTNALRRVQEWFLVDGDRLFVAALLSIAVFLSMLALGEVGLISFANDDSITRLAGGMIAGTFSLVTLVVSINQLILSREFTAAGEARDQIDGVVSFRRDVAKAAAVPAAPAAPTKLLELIVATIHHRADALDDAVSDHDEAVRGPIASYVAGLRESTERLDDTLEHAQFGTVKAVSAAVAFDDAWQQYAGTHLRHRHEGALSEEATAAFDELLGALQLFAVAREHFKTTYLQRELTRFSQLTIYTGVPAILSALLIGFVFADLTGPTLSIAVLPYVVSALVAVVVSPLALLVAYILRTATVTRRTASSGPMLPQKDPDAGPFDVSYGDRDGRAGPGDVPAAGEE